MKTQIILIGYHNRIIADGLSAILNRVKDYALAGVVSHGDELLEKIRVYESDILIMELDQDRRLENRYLTKVKKLNPNQKILILSDLVARNLLEEWLNIGIDGYVLRSCSAEELIFAIHKLAASEKYLSSKVATSLLSNTQCTTSTIELTSRERQVMALMFQLDSNHEIAEKLNISETTVRTHRKNIRQKFGGKANHIRMLMYACRENLLNNNGNPICSNCRLYHAAN